MLKGLQETWLEMDFLALLGDIGTNRTPIIAAFFIGLMMAVSPCPLVTNITAVAYISRDMGDIKKVMLNGLLFTLGRAFSYVGLAGLIVYIGVNVRVVALFLQSYGERMLGPLLLLAGLVMLGIVGSWPNAGSRSVNRLKTKLGEKDYFGAFFLGVVFALSFCPLSGVLYFGMLIQLALKAGDALMVPTSFAVATGLPVIAASILMVKSAETLGRAINKIQVLEGVVRRGTGWVFIAAGVYLMKEAAGI